MIIGDEVHRRRRRLGEAQGDLAETTGLNVDQTTGLNVTMSTRHHVDRAGRVSLVGKEGTHHRISPKKWQNTRLSSNEANPLSRSRN